MDRDKQVAKIAKIMQGGIYDALTLSGIPEVEISKYIHGFHDMYEISVITNFIKTLTPVTEKLNCFYKHYSKEAWNMLSLTIPQVPELRVLSGMKGDVRKAWRARPKVKR